MTKKRKRFPYWLTMMTIVLVGTASWALYSLINQAISDVLLTMGIESTYLQLFIVIALVVTFLIIMGYSIKKAMNKIIK